MSQIVVTLVDYGGEKSTFTANATDPAGGDAWSVLLGLMTTLETAVENFSRGYLESIYFRAAGVANPPEVASDPDAQREMGARFFYHEDTTNTKGFITVPMPDLANLDILPGTDLLDMADTETAALITWIEATIYLAGALVEVDRVVIVGRNN